MAHITTNWQRCIKPIVHRLRLNPSSGKFILYHADSIFQTVNRIPSGIPAAQAWVHPAPLGQYIPPDTHDVGDVLT